MVPPFFLFLVFYLSEFETPTPPRLHFVSSLCINCNSPPTASHQISSLEVEVGGRLQLATPRRQLRGFYLRIHFLLKLIMTQ